MINTIMLVFFLCFSFITWISVSFRISAIFVNEDWIFEKLKRAFWFYVINGIVAFIMTFFCYILVCLLQRVVI